MHSRSECSDRCQRQPVFPAHRVSDSHIDNEVTQQEPGVQARVQEIEELVSARSQERNFQSWWSKCNCRE
eukprot:5110960-Amphidinium_carterae.3